MIEIPIIFKHGSVIPIKNDLKTSGSSHPSIFSSAQDFGFAIPVPYDIMVEKGSCKFIAEDFESELRMVKGDSVIPLNIKIFIPEEVAFFNYGYNLPNIKEYMVDRETHPSCWYTPKIIATLAPGRYTTQGVYLRILPIVNQEYHFLYKEEKDERK